MPALRTVRDVVRRALVGVVIVACGGTLLALPRGASATVRTYVVSPGDNLTAIANRFDVTLSELRTLNKIRHDNHILVGQTLRVPVVAVKTRIPARLRAHPDRLALRPLFAKWAKRNAIPVDLLEATLWLESGWNQHRVSSTGAVGVGQLMPGTAAFIERELIGVDLNPYATQDNIRMSARYLRFLLRMHGGDSNEALHAYYQGVGSIRANGLYLDTKQYAAAIQSLRRQFRADPTGR